MSIDPHEHIEARKQKQHSEPIVLREVPHGLDAVVARPIGRGRYIAEAACANLPKRPCTSGLLREAIIRASQWQERPLDEQQRHIAMGISERTLSRRFVAETGFTYTAWRQRARLMRALELLAEGQAITVVPLDLGYDSVSAFIALFKRTLGVTPSAYFQRT